jgi:hypothetical protein
MQRFRSSTVGGGGIVVSGTGTPSTIAGSVLPLLWARVLDAVPRAKTTATALPVSSRLRRELIPDPFLPDDGES